MFILSLCAFGLSLGLAVCAYFIILKDGQNAAKNWAKVQLWAALGQIVITLFISINAGKQIDRIDLTTDSTNQLVKKNSDDNIQTGHLNFELQPPYLDSNFIYIHFGGNSTKIFLSEMTNTTIIENALNSQTKILKFLLVDNRFFVSIKVFDLDRNLIGEVDRNDWRPNINYTQKFNYDSHGFEVFNNSGQIAFNITLDGNVLTIRGIFFDPEAKAVVAACDETSEVVPFGTPRLDSMTEIMRKMPAKDYIYQLAGQCAVAQIFNYSGPDWRGERLKSEK